MRRTLAILITTMMLLVIGLLPATAQQGVFYTVRGGDTLASIAGQFGVPVNTIATANNITNPNNVFAGQVLFIPGVQVAAPAAQSTPQQQFGTGGPTGVIIAPNSPGIAPTATPVPVIVQPQAPVVVQPANPTQNLTYTVQTGDTLFEIAVRFGVTTEAIAQLNGITNVNSIRVGQVLTLPQGAALQFGTGGPVTRPAGSFQYVVQPGDYVELLSIRFGTSIEAIDEANDLENVGRIFPGQVLVIP